MTVLRKQRNTEFFWRSCLSVNSVIFFSSRYSYDKCQVFAIRFLPFRRTVFISYEGMFLKFYSMTLKLYCKTQKTTRGTRAWSSRNFTPRNIIYTHTSAAPEQRTPSAVFFSLDLTEKMGCNNCKSQCTTLVASIGKETKIVQAISP